ncbi:hypothetical protein WDJ51_08895 [Rathayibacter sp. YIM 133350]|uniref:hypothetical protein n=1 Tax=Rathayibacter sp. YIM 133350 TaxID=3131992 RepID=UPI00307E49D2
MESALASWSDFNVAMAGASAALAGLIIVAMSVNIADVLKSPQLATRSGATIAALVLAITASMLGLIPDNPVWALGWEVLAATAFVWVIEAFAIRAISGNREQPRGARTAKIVLGVAAPVAYSVGSVLALAGNRAGLVVIGVGSIVAVASAVIIAWVVLVEVLR